MLVLRRRIGEVSNLRVNDELVKIQLVRLEPSAMAVQIGIQASMSVEIAREEVDKRGPGKCIVEDGNA